MTMRPLPPHRSHRGGFSFAEVLFAVMILGIGFIMVAAMFPVAIQQSKTNTNQTVAARVAESAFAVIEQNADRLTTFGSGVQPVIPGGPTTLWSRLLHTLVYQPDPRYGCAVLGRLAGTNPRVVQMYVVVMQVNNRERYVEDLDLADSGGNPVTNPSTFRPHTVYVKVTDSGIAGEIQFCDGNGPTGSPLGDDSPAPAAAAPGAVLITSRGYIYRLGRQVSNDTWELAADGGMSSVDVVETDPITAYLIGRGHDNPGTGDPANYTGSNQAIAVYTKLIPVP